MLISFLFVSSKLISARKFPLDDSIDGVSGSGLLEVVGWKVLKWRSSYLVSPIRLLVTSSHIVRDIWQTHICIKIHLELLFLSESYGALLFSFFSCIFMYKVCINKSETQSWVENGCCIEDSRIKIRIICFVY